MSKNEMNPFEPIPDVPFQIILAPPGAIYYVNYITTRASLIFVRYTL